MLGVAGAVGGQLGVQGDELLRLPCSRLADSWQLAEHGLRLPGPLRLGGGLAFGPGSVPVEPQRSCHGACSSFGLRSCSRCRGYGFPDRLVVRCSCIDVEIAIFGVDWLVVRHVEQQGPPRDILHGFDALQVPPGLLLSTPMHQEHVQELGRISTLTAVQVADHILRERLALHRQWPGSGRCVKRADTAACQEMPHRAGELLAAARLLCQVMLLINAARAAPAHQPILSPGRRKQSMLMHHDRKTACSCMLLRQSPLLQNTINLQYHPTFKAAGQAWCQKAREDTCYGDYVAHEPQVVVAQCQMAPGSSQPCLWTG